MGLLESAWIQRLAMGPRLDAGNGTRLPRTAGSPEAEEAVSDAGQGRRDSTRAMICASFPLPV